ncbi:hypothetical protein HG536_0H03500 [Torulaspora globosa]|uniref:Uncharacterized protein n=1 Tax=Torulaspora globosa TaxID=48254 RepID=A0A7G3ZN88_9SACH|nr:uncharacterized protein HG536_0H03500 [Torulaspora globosa]QLL34974.1 hypothetical protein HG536_0H03500 [Torulaspora globosa]
MSQRKLTLFIEDWQEPLYNGANDSDLSKLLIYTSAQKAMLDAINELHALTDEVISYRTTGSVSSGIPSLMSHAMQTRERAKGLYRSALRSRVSDGSWDLEELFKELDEELLRSTGVLRLYQRRGSYY